MTDNTQPAPPNYVTVQVPPETRQRLRVWAVIHQMTYEQAINYLIDRAEAPVSEKQIA